MPTEQLEAFGLDWGTWIYDCPSGASSIAAADTMSFALSIEIDLGEALEQTLGFLPEDTRDRVTESVTSQVPEGRGTLEFSVLPVAGATPCLSGTRHVFAAVALMAQGSVEVTLSGGATISLVIQIVEHLDTQFRDCDCDPEQTSLREAGLRPAMLASVVNLPASMDSFLRPLHREVAGEDGRETSGRGGASEEFRSARQSRVDSDVTIIEGIDDVLAENLRSDAGIETLGELAEIDPTTEDVHQISEERLNRFRAMAEQLVTFPQLDQQDAELLTVGLGVESVDRLREASLEMKADELERAIAETSLPADYDISRVRNLLKSIST